MNNFVYPSITPQDALSTTWTEEIYRKTEAEFQSGQNAWYSARLADDAIRYPGYTHLYKYRTVDLENPERTTKILSDKTVWSASLDRFNDPLEAAFMVAAGLPQNKIAKALLNLTHSQWWGCVSFSSDPVCVQMWAHYAAEHGGICIQYRRADSFLLCSGNCQPMAYERYMPVVDRLDDNIHKLFWTKSDSWEYEQEWRLMYPRARAYVGSGLLVPSGVVFGLRTSNEVKDLICKSSPGLRFGNIVPGKTAFGLNIVWESHHEK